MLLTVEDFCDTVDINLSGLVDSLTEETGRASPEERQAWSRSLIPLSRSLASAQEGSHGIGSAQIYLGNVALEYRLPAASAWCDAVLLGQDSVGSARAVIIELKHWQTEQDQSGPSEALIYHKGRLTLHPAEQVRGYTEYCRRFHSTVLDRKAGVDGCVFFTKETPLEAYVAEPHARQLFRASPGFFRVTTCREKEAALRSAQMERAAKMHDFAGGDPICEAVSLTLGNGPWCSVRPRDDHIDPAIT